MSSRPRSTLGRVPGKALPLLLALALLPACGGGDKAMNKDSTPKPKADATTKRLRATQKRLEQAGRRLDRQREQLKSQGGAARRQATRPGGCPAGTVPFVTPKRHGCVGP